MNLFQPLILAEATTVSVNMVLFDPAGNARAFEGAYRPTGELSGAVVTLAGKSTTPIRLASEKVAHFALQRQEKKGMTVQVRIHLKEGEPDELLPLLHFLNTLNKSNFEATIEDAQIPLGTQPANPSGDRPDEMPVPDEAGLYPTTRVTRRPFSHKKLKAELQQLTVEDGWIAGWSMMANFEKPSNGGEALSVRSTVFASEAEALENAGRELLNFTRRDTFIRSGKTEDRAYGEFLGWLFDLLPALTKDVEVPA